MRDSRRDSARRASITGVLREISTCRTCNKKPSVHCEILQELEAVRFLFRCHRMYETEVIPEDLLDRAEEEGTVSAVLFCLATRFLRSVARYGGLGQAGRLLRASRPALRASVTSRKGWIAR